MYIDISRRCICVPNVHRYITNMYVSESACTCASHRYIDRYITNIFVSESACMCVSHMC